MQHALTSSLPRTLLAHETPGLRAVTWPNPSLRHEHPQRGKRMKRSASYTFGLAARPAIQLPAHVRTQHTDARRLNAEANRDFILSILQAQPSARDSRSYLKAFASEDPAAFKRRSSALFESTRGLRKQDPAAASISDNTDQTDESDFSTEADLSEKTKAAIREGKNAELVESLLNPITRHTAVVKIQGPFTSRQIASIAEGLVYLERLGLVSIVVVDDEAWYSSASSHVGAGASQMRKEMVMMATKLAEAIESIGGRAMPLLNSLFRLSAGADEEEFEPSKGRRDYSQNATTRVGSLQSLKATIARGELPIIAPLAYDSAFCAVAVPANDAIKALVVSLGLEGRNPPLRMSSSSSAKTAIDLTPLRMMIINREGGIPSPARGGNPHLSINLESEYEHIHDTFIWGRTHPTSLDNLLLAKECLDQLPRTSSAVIVSHRSPRALIANLITNKPAHSPSLHHSLLPAKQISHTPTIVRKGLPIRVIRNMEDVEQDKLTKLMEASFRRTLNAEAYYSRLDSSMDFVIVAGYPGSETEDYQAAAIVTLERDSLDSTAPPISYLDKFAVLPSLQGDGTVDFLWTALRDETFGLGLLDALNPNGGKEGLGVGTDLVWRSRADNPVNKWYFERSNGFVHIKEMGKGGTPGTLFWCDAEDKLIRIMEREADESGRGNERRGLPMVTREEEGRLAKWSRVIGGIKSCWK